MGVKQKSVDLRVELRAAYCRSFRKRSILNAALYRLAFSTNPYPQCFMPKEWEAEGYRSLNDIAIASAHLKVDGRLALFTLAQVQFMQLADCAGEGPIRSKPFLPHHPVLDRIKKVNHLSIRMVAYSKDELVLNNIVSWGIAPKVKARSFVFILARLHALSAAMGDYLREMRGYRARLVMIGMLMQEGGWFYWAWKAPGKRQGIKYRPETPREFYGHYETAMEEVLLFPEKCQRLLRSLRSGNSKSRSLSLWNEVRDAIKIISWPYVLHYEVYYPELDSSGEEEE